jgi:nucleoside-diphosphate-sugar epimerase
MKMIDNRDGRANRRIYNVGNPDNSLSVRELAMEMLRIAATYPEYRVNAAKVRLVDTTAAEYYGKGYQDVENRVPKIDNTRADLEWSPRVSMQEALRQIFDAYRGEIAQAGQLLEQEVRP